MQILRAAHLGMCFGVRDAIELAVRHSETAPLTVLGDLVHNDAVLARLRTSTPDEVVDRVESRIRALASADVPGRIGVAAGQAGQRR